MAEKISGLQALKNPLQILPYDRLIKAMQPDFDPSGTNRSVISSRFGSFPERVTIISVYGDHKVTGTRGANAILHSHQMRGNENENCC